MNDKKVWYMGNKVIMEIRSTSINDSLGIITVKRPFQYYLFIDRNSKSFYHYSSFSDTARILYSYTQPDSAELQGKGGWRFYAKNYIKYTDLLSIADTTIKNIKYKRIKYTEQVGKYRILTIGYLRCDKKGSIFQIDGNITEQIGCPMVRTDQVRNNEILYPTSEEIVFIRDSLSTGEKKVFDAWEKNLKKYPVNK